MKKLLLFLVFGISLSATLAQSPDGVKHDAKYVKALYAKYPVVKSDFCADCYLWVNPYYRSIANVNEHRPLVEYEYYTKENAALADQLKIPRQKPKKGKPPVSAIPFESAFAAWNHVAGQPSEDGVYSVANAQVKAKNPKDEIAKGHVQAWILNAFAIDAVILSDTYTFNAAPEDQKQNVGTEIATEELTRKYLGDADVEVWGGTFGRQGSFTDGTITAVYPAYYWKIIKVNGTMSCYWMPNLITETQTQLDHCIRLFDHVSTGPNDQPGLLQLLGFDPTKVFPGKN